MKKESQSRADAVQDAASPKTAYKFLREVSPMSYVVAPVIYSMIIPAVILDVFVSFYQMICFPVYGISKVERRKYLSLDRHKLTYLNWIERINCDYCAYLNGIIAYSREIASRTEQYFCPIRHELHTDGLHARHSKFLPYGDAATYREKISLLRDEVRDTKLVN